MNAKDQQKVISSGFTIVRRDDTPSPRIKIKDRDIREWRTLQKFDTKAARDREMSRLLKFWYIIED